MELLLAFGKVPFNWLWFPIEHRLSRLGSGLIHFLWEGSQGSQVTVKWSPHTFICTCRRRLPFVELGGWRRPTSACSCWTQC